MEKAQLLNFMPSPVDGDDPYKLYGMVLYDCTKAAERLEDTLSTTPLQKQFPNISAR